MSSKYRNFAFPVLAYLAVLALLLPVNVLTDYLYIFLLCLPLLDTLWVRPQLSVTARMDFAYMAVLLASIVLLLIAYPDQIKYFVGMLVFVAVPEEWFFRAYLLIRAGSGYRGNLIVSAAFSLLHGIQQNSIMMLLVFVPSLVFGWVYQKTGSFYITVLLHALSNLIFVIYIKDMLENVFNITAA